MPYQCQLTIVHDLHVNLSLPRLFRANWYTRRKCIGMVGYTVTTNIVTRLRVRARGIGIMGSRCDNGIRSDT